MKTSRVGPGNLASVAALLAGVLVAGSARAHSGLFRADEIRVNPRDPSDIVVQSTNWGLVRTDGGGFQFTCYEAYGVRTYTTRRTPFEILDDGGLLIASMFEGLWIGSADGCSYEPVAGFDDKVVLDVHREASSGALYVLAVDDSRDATGDATTAVYRSYDEGRSFDVLFKTTTNVVAQSFWVAGNPPRVYVTGAIIASATVPAFLVWDEADDAFEPLLTLADGQWEVVAVHPANPDLVLVTRKRQDDGLTELSYDLWFSRNGGVSFDPLAQEIVGLSFSPDGDELAFGGPYNGLHVVQVAELMAGDGVSAERRYDGRFWGIEWTAQGLYAGTNDFGGETADFNASLAVSHDGGYTFEPVMRVCDVTLRECPATSQHELTCRSHFEEEVSGFVAYIEAPVCVPPAATPDAGGVDLDAGGASAGDASDGPAKRSLDVHTATCSTTRGARGGDGRLGAIAFGLGMTLLRRRKARR